MKKIIFRVDDRFIHGQVVEGWINYYGIKNIILVSDKIRHDEMKSKIFLATIPSDATLKIMDINEFNLFDTTTIPLNKFTLIIVGGVDDIYDIKDNIPKGSYINVGCAAKFDGAIKVADYCYLDNGKIEKMEKLSKNFDIYVHKLPWDKHISIKKILKIKKKYES